jgi:two-component system sensor histidine kinase KdpD
MIGPVDDVRRGRLRVYLGAAPGVGKTYAMLDEARRRVERGTDVVVALVETHGRAGTAALLDGLEVVPRRTVEHRGTTLTDLDVDAVLARHPEIALVDELAHTNAPGGRHAKRWEDVEDLLAAGIDVVTTVNVQHLESLNDVARAITGVRQQETVPDAVVRRADQIELVDMSPEALRRRLAHGNVYAAETVDAALTQYFRVGNLTALRELALLWTADRVDDALEAYRTAHGISDPWPARERVVVAVTGGPETETLLRRGARIAAQSAGGQLLAVHVLRGDGLRGAPPDALARQRLLVEQLGGTWHTVVADDVAGAVLEVARGVNASRIVLGVTRRSRLAQALSPGVGTEVIRDAGDIDVLVVTHPHAGGRRLRRPPHRGTLTARRRLLGWGLALAGPPALALALDAATTWDTLSIALMLFLALTVGVALVAGLVPALVAAALGGALSNVLFAPPVGTWSITEPRNALAIVVLVAVAIGVSAVVDLAARRTAEAARARAEADTLAATAAASLGGEDPAGAALEALREALRLRHVVAQRRAAPAAPWVDVATAHAPAAGAAPGAALDAAPGAGPGAAPHDGPDDGPTEVPVTDALRLVLTGRTPPPHEVRLARAVGLQVEAVLERDALRVEAGTARAERERGAMRTALLAAVSHDLRTPLAAIKASVSALRSLGDAIPADERTALLGDAEHNADRLQHLVDDLLDMSRLDAGVVVPRRAPVALDEVVPAALAGVPEGAVDVDVPEDLPLVTVDAALLERALANVVENAVRYGGAPVRVSAGQVDDVVVVRVVDHGPGVPDDRKAAMFTAFQRLDDAPRGHGLGLGLAVARGFVTADGGTLDAEDTPGGGLTMVLTIPLDGGDA